MKLNPGLVIVGGLLGTPIMTALIYVLAPLMGVKMDLVEMLAETLGGWRMGMLVHIFNGAIIFPLLFVFVFYRLLPGPAWLKAISFGVVLWLASQLIALPLMGAGLFSTRAGGASTVAVLLAGHLAYGGLLGLFATIAEREQSLPRTDETTSPWIPNRLRRSS